MQKLERGAGYGHVVQEQAQLILLGMQLRRPITFEFEDEHKIFDGNGSIFTANTFPEAHVLNFTFRTNDETCKKYEKDGVFLCRDFKVRGQLRSACMLRMV